MSRFSRQQDLVPAKISQEKIILVGAGAVGRQVGLTLASIGAKNVRVVDMDVVDTTNICTQGYNKNNIGGHKATILAESMRLLDYEGDADIQGDAEIWRPSKYKDYNPTVIFMCTDNMESRNSIYKFAQRTESVQLIVDTRMLGHVMRLLCYKREDFDEYANTLFTDDEAEEGRCTRRSTMYTASPLANYAVAEFAFYLRGIKPRKEYHIDILDELTR